VAAQSAAREQATPGFPVGEATGALLVRSLMALVPNHRQRFVTGRAPLIRTPRTALGWGFITNSGTTDGYGSASYAVWSGFVILEEGSIYEISHAHGAVLGPSGLPK
jgi:hypothetical protein